MTETYLLICDGKRYEGITLDQAKQRLLDSGRSYQYVEHLLSKAIGRNYAPATIGWAPGRTRNWIIDGVRLGYKAAHFALVFKGHTDEEAACLLRCGKLLAEIESELQC